MTGGRSDEPGGPFVDLNADTGEGFDDAGLLGIVTSANMACGGHAGDERSLRPVVTMAAARGVSVGAQVSYVDRTGFGRRRLDRPPGELAAEVEAQLALLQRLCLDVGTSVRYLKPHGALYHEVLGGGPQADAVAAVAGRHGLPLLLMPGSPFRSVREGFADRTYDDSPEGPRLRSRDRPGAVVSPPDDAAAQAIALASAGVQSVCVHGDSPGAVAIATTVRRALEEAGWVLRAFA